MPPQILWGISLIVLPLPSERAGERLCRVCFRLLFPHSDFSITPGYLAICSPSPFGEGRGEAVSYLKQKTPKGLGAALRGCFITREDCLFRQKRESVTVLRGGETKSLYVSPCFNHLKRITLFIEKFHIKHLHIGVNLDVLVVAFQHEYWVIALVFRVESTQCMGKGSTSEVVIVNTSC